jgi:transposase
MRIKRWDKSGVWKRMIETVSGDHDLEVLMIDSTAVRAHQHASWAKKRRSASHWLIVRGIDQ